MEELPLEIQKFQHLVLPIILGILGSGIFTVLITSFLNRKKNKAEIKSIESEAESVIAKSILEYAEGMRLDLSELKKELKELKTEYSELQKSAEDVDKKNYELQTSLDKIVKERDYFKSELEKLKNSPKK